MKEVAKLVAVQVTDDLTCYGYLMNNDKKILVDTLLDALKEGEKAKGRKTGITRKDIEKIVEREFEKKCEEEGMVKHGKWVEESRKADGIFDLYQTFIICSICGNEHYYGTGDKPNFCDKCGAKMDLEE